MKLVTGLVRGALAATLITTLWSADPINKPISAEDMFAEDDCTSLQLSPDGHYLAFLTTLGWGKVGIALMDLTTNKPPEALVSAKDENIKMFFWKGDDWIVYAGDLGGNESYALRSLCVAAPAPGKKRKVIALSEAYKERTQEDADQVTVVDPLRYDPENILVFGRRATGSRSIGMYRINIRTGTRAPAPGYDPVSNFASSDDVADHNGVLRARAVTERDRITYEVRPRPDASYVKIASLPANEPGWDFLFFAPDNETLYLLDSQQTDTAVLRTLNVRTREFSAPLYRPPEGEIAQVITSWDRSKLYGVAYNSDKMHYHFFDADRERLQRSVDAALRDTTNAIVSSSRDEKTHVIIAYSDRDPGTYYLLKNGRLTRIAQVAQRINPAAMCAMEPIQYQARDGLVIHGYLTRPAGAVNGRVPLIINPHGGPYGIRDDWGFNREVQFLASRGYAVLQVNYRGSGGYGHAFQKAGYHEWGNKMQDDLTDAVKWAIDQGIADPHRVAIVGASYGGYAALAGVVFTPDLYRCAVNYVGVSDLDMLVGDGRVDGAYVSEQFFRDRVGTDRAILRARSPVNFIERLLVPLLNAYGENDRRVDIAQWEKLKSKLDAHKKPYEIIIEENEGHGFRNERNRVAFYRKVEEFLKKSLAPAP